jgi:hypothetical protein
MSLLHSGLPVSTIKRISVCCFKPHVPFIHKTLTLANEERRYLANATAEALAEHTSIGLVGSLVEKTFLAAIA